MEGSHRVELGPAEGAERLNPARPAVNREQGLPDSETNQLHVNLHYNLIFPISPPWTCFPVSTEHLLDKYLATLGVHPLTHTSPVHPARSSRLTQFASFVWTQTDC